MFDQIRVARADRRGGPKNHFLLYHSVGLRNGHCPQLDRVTTGEGLTQTDGAPARALKTRGEASSTHSQFQSGCY